jgi:hypothetical protein
MAQPAITPVQIPSPVQPVSEETDQVRLQFPNTDIQPILKFYESLTGKRVIADNSAVGQISIDISKPVPRDEAIRIIETALYINGYALVPGEGDIVKLVGAGKNPRQFGVNIYSDISQIPDNVGVVSVLFQLQYADSKDIRPSSTSTSASPPTPVPSPSPAPSSSRRVPSCSATSRRSSPPPTCRLPRSSAASTPFSAPMPRTSSTSSTNSSKKASRAIPPAVPPPLP